MPERQLAVKEARRSFFDKLRQEAVPLRHCIIGTAGHVDHGKTALTLALTGVDTDALAEEKRRGLTIEPGFASLTLPGGIEASIVDVPGHEKFIRNMLAGAAGVDLVLLAVAADEGFMPQTREHLGICGLLGVRRGVVALTKSDRVDKPRLEAAMEEVRAETAGTFLAEAPIIPVSARTGAGLEELTAALARLAEAAEKRPEGGAFRLAVDRVFTRPGFGVVVTGTLAEGAVALGDEVCLYPAGKRARVRGVQHHAVPAERLEAGQRAALNLAGVERSELGRGDTVAAPGSMTVTGRADVRLTLLPGAAYPVKSGCRLHLHHGTSSQICRCTLLGRSRLEPGESCYARLHLNSPLAARPGDRFVVRFFSPVVTVGGGLLLDLSPRRKQNDPLIEEELAALETGEARELVPVGVFQMEAEALAGAEARAGALLGAYHEAYPLRDGMNLEELRGKLLPGAGTALAGAVVEELARRRVIYVKGPVAALSGFRPRYDERSARMLDALLVRYLRAGLVPETNEAVAASFGADAELCRQVAGRMVTEGRLVALSGEYRVHQKHHERALEILYRLYETADVVSLARFRDACGVSRRYALLLLEYWDGRGVTAKSGEGRILIRPR